MSVIWTLLLANNAWAANDTIWRTTPGGTGGGECNPLKPGKQCFWSFDATGWSPMLGRFGGHANDPPCLSVQIRLFLPGAEVPEVDIYACHNDTTGDCEQVEATNLRTGTYGDVTLDSTDWGVRDITDTEIKANVTTVSTCDNCELIAECGN